MGIGDRIREIREAKKLSTRSLAEKTEVSASLISQIESGKVDPSLSTLRKIAVALDVALFSLVLVDDSEPTNVVKKHERRSIVWPNAGLDYEIIHSDQSKKIALMIGTLAPGGATSESLLNHPGEECLLVQKGVLTVCVGSESLDLEEGDSLYFDSTIPHRLRNIRDEECKFYLIITPPKF
jgi:transcriptional regulator with XRE-family HTH domain